MDYARKMEEKYGTLGYHNGRFGDFDEVTIDTLVISTVSNWGAYAVEAYMQQLKKVRLLPSYKEIKRYLETIERMGSVDGVTGRQSASVDGFPLEVEREILLALDVAASAAEAGEARKAG
ncbi:DUF4392 domain-containing protein [Clostridium sp. AF15-17LB]|nr:DUF4392 domain-containing protein [Clostridium sp. AF15-17LB]